jgi:excisionase family DNA binding protein
MNTNTIYTEAEFCKQVGISRTTAWRLREAGKLSHYRIGNKIRYGQEHIREFLSRCEQQAKPARARGLRNVA